MTLDFILQVLKLALVFLLGFGDLLIQILYMSLEKFQYDVLLTLNAIFFILPFIILLICWAILIAKSQKQYFPIRDFKAGQTEINFKIKYFLAFIKQFLISMPKSVYFTFLMYFRVFGVVILKQTFENYQAFMTEQLINEINEKMNQENLENLYQEENDNIKMRYGDDQAVVQQQQNSIQHTEQQQKEIEMKKKKELQAQASEKIRKMLKQGKEALQLNKSKFSSAQVKQPSSILQNAASMSIRKGVSQDKSMIIKEQNDESNFSMNKSVQDQSISFQQGRQKSIIDLSIIHQNQHQDYSQLNISDFQITNQQQLSQNMKESKQNSIISQAIKQQQNILEEQQKRKEVLKLEKKILIDLRQNEIKEQKVLYTIQSQQLNYNENKQIDDSENLEPKDLKQQNSIQQNYFELENVILENSSYKTNKRVNIFGEFLDEVIQSSKEINQSSKFGPKKTQNENIHPSIQQDQINGKDSINFMQKNQSQQEDQLKTPQMPALKLQASSSIKKHIQKSQSIYLQPVEVSFQKKTEINIQTSQQSNNQENIDLQLSANIGFDYKRFLTNKLLFQYLVIGNFIICIFSTMPNLGLNLVNISILNNQSGIALAHLILGIFNIFINSFIGLNDIFYNNYYSYYFIESQLSKLKAKSQIHIDSRFPIPPKVVIDSNIQLDRLIDLNPTSCLNIQKLSFQPPKQRYYLPILVNSLEKTFLKLKNLTHLHIDLQYQFMQESYIINSIQTAFTDCGMLEDIYINLIGNTIRKRSYKRLVTSLTEDEQSIKLFRVLIISEKDLYYKKSLIDDQAYSDFSIIQKHSQQNLRKIQINLSEISYLDDQIQFEILKLLENISVKKIEIFGNIQDYYFSQVYRIINDKKCIQYAHILLEEKSYWKWGQLQRIFKYDTQNISLDLEISDYKKLGQVGCRVLSDSIQVCNSIEVFDLQLFNQKVGSQGAFQIFYQMQKHINLQELTLDISKNFLSDEVMLSLSGCLSLFQFLKKLYLYLDCNSIQAEGCKYISYGLQQLVSLQELLLSLENNKVLANGLNQISQALPYFSKLKELHLNYSDCLLNTDKQNEDELKRNKNLGFKSVLDMSALYLSFQQEDQEMQVNNSLSLKAQDLWNQSVFCTQLFKNMPEQNQFHALSLILRNCHIGSLQSRLICLTLCKMKNLTYLNMDLSDNLLEREGVNYIFSGLKKLVYVNKLILKLNRVNSLLSIPNIKEHSNNVEDLEKQKDEIKVFVKMLSNQVNQYEARIIANDCEIDQINEKQLKIADDIKDELSKQKNEILQQEQTLMNEEKDISQKTESKQLRLNDAYNQKKENDYKRKSILIQKKQLKNKIQEYISPRKQKAIQFSNEKEEILNNQLNVLVEQKKSLEKENERLQSYIKESKLKKDQQNNLIFDYSKKQNLFTSYLKNSLKIMNQLNIINFEFSQNFLIHYDIYELFYALENIRSLKSITFNFSNNYLGNLGIKHILSIFRIQKDLSFIDINLENNQINADGLFYISCILQECTQLSKIRIILKNNRIESDDRILKFSQTLLERKDKYEKVILDLCDNVCVYNTDQEFIKALHIAYPSSFYY
ncbi:transmembrane protein, putative (macronuclear) [Tetrahymena thermophila SB210]|uniref:Transmembrane protein, putative n=1 Tax=Tetrahymena thermophila (strain SB210) TaxID=312017 RepID=Q22B71_TETTS|nr:transmembrane protein, putative [Tetrahymena thermophila SB210]EAR82530.2 transmembrane protein, putative [Tetrahymena thermophila SB210]|eukprot:XP_001030193.2 transmembrane protein, putative [Tetrahymena thermophila SB210]